MGGFVVSKAITPLLGGERADTPCKWCDTLLSRCAAGGQGHKCCPDCRHPKRVQRTRRTKGSKLHGGAVSITRPSRYGNPFRIVGMSVVGMDWSDVVDWDHGVGAMPEADVLYFEAADLSGAVEHAVELYRQLLAVRQQEWEPARFGKWISGARGRDVACYCPPSAPCHGDPLLEAANALDLDLEVRHTCSGCGKGFTEYGLRSHRSGRFANPACRVHQERPTFQGKPTCSNNGEVDG